MISTSQKAALERTSLHVLHDQLDGFGTSSLLNATTLETIVEEIVTTVRCALASALQQLNRTRLRQPPLPNELWCQVWEKLPVHDRMVVSHVSSDWRQAASCCPQLWSSTSFVSTLHSEDCQCATCAADSPQNAGRCKRCRRPVPQTWANLELVQHHIKLSGGLPLSLNVDFVSTGTANGDILVELAGSLRPEIGRLETLQISVDDMTILQAGLFSSFGELPSLKSLTISYLGDDEHEWSTDIRLPVLSRLHMTGRLRYLTAKFNMACPSVKHLHAVFYQGRDAHVLLRTCPAVQDLLLQVGPERVYPGERQETIDLRELYDAAKPPRVSITEIHESDCEAVLPLFSNPDCPDLTFGYVGDSPMSGLTNILSEITHPVSLSCQQTRDVITVRSVGLDSSVRTVTHRLFDSQSTEAFPNNIWTCLSVSFAQSLRTLSINGALWPKIFRRVPPGPTTIAELTIEFAREADYTDWKNIGEALPEEFLNQVDKLRLDNLWGKPLPFEETPAEALAHLYHLLRFSPTVQFLERHVEFSPSSRAWYRA
ncbi:hypothetical protein BKA62DRAFT_703966 [Auriculariales sp. MPI-PUGE-AT-0066]|nr:hypothetical protein BKA62DRAFT_703966 [Auriculariales sp. MPI-PUGE-AT-0066]